MYAYELCKKYKNEKGNNATGDWIYQIYKLEVMKQFLNR